MTELGRSPEPNFEEVVASLDPADLVIVEGYKSAPIPKIEARRAAQVTKRRLSDDDPRVIAIAADHRVTDARVPVFDLDDVTAIADFIAERLGLAAATHPDEARTRGSSPSQ